MMSICFFFNDPATTEIYTLSLHDALPISVHIPQVVPGHRLVPGPVRQMAFQGQLIMVQGLRVSPPADRKSTRLNSSHSQISYAVFCLKKKNKKPEHHSPD